jgi:hypothetical protein
MGRRADVSSVDDGTTSAVFVVPRRMGTELPVAHARYRPRETISQRIREAVDSAVRFPTDPIAVSTAFDRARVRGTKASDTWSHGWLYWAVRIVARVWSTEFSRDDGHFPFGFGGADGCGGTGGSGCASLGAGGIFNGTTFVHSRLTWSSHTATSEHADELASRRPWSTASLYRACSVSSSGRHPSRTLAVFWRFTANVMVAATPTVLVARSSLKLNETVPHSRYPESTGELRPRAATPTIRFLVGE